MLHTSLNVGRPIPNGSPREVGSVKSFSETSVVRTAAGTDATVRPFISSLHFQGSSSNTPELVPPPPELVPPSPRTENDDEDDDFFGPGISNGTGSGSKTPSSTPALPTPTARTTTAARPASGAWTTKHTFTHLGRTYELTRGLGATQDQWEALEEQLIATADKTKNLLRAGIDTTLNLRHDPTGNGRNGLSLEFQGGKGRVIVPITDDELTALSTAYQAIAEYRAPTYAPQEIKYNATDLSPTAPRPLLNGGRNNCWINSMVQMMVMDKGANDWFTNFPSDWVNSNNLPDAIKEQDDPFDYRDHNIDPNDPNIGYIEFLAKIPQSERVNVWKALVAFHQVFKAYEDARNNPKAAPIDTRGLRKALYDLAPHKMASANSQEDTMDWFSDVVADFLLPNDLKICDRTQVYYRDNEGNLKSNPEVPRTVPVIPYLVLAFPLSRDERDGSFHVQQMVKENLVDEIPRRITAQEDGEDYPSTSVETTYPTDPLSMWLHVKARINDQGVKVDTPVIADPILDIDGTTMGLDAVLIHTGKANSGHFAVLQKVQERDDQGNLEPVWYYVSDSQIKRINPATRERLMLRNAYAYHYTKIDRVAEL